jgi:sodium transport system permease protein
VSRAETARAALRRPPTWKATLLVALHELRGSFRDQQTVLYAVLVPLFLYPLIFWLLIQGSLVVRGRSERTEVQVGVAYEAGAEQRGTLVEALSTRPGAQSAAMEGAELERVEPLQARGTLPEEGARAWLSAAGPRVPDAVLWIPAEPGAPAQLFYDSTHRASRLAKERVTARLEPLTQRLREDRARALGKSPLDLVPFEVQEANVAPERDLVAYALSFLLPMLLVVMCVLGAFFPAVDLTAGEKERSTAETTLLLPIPRLAVHQGKILAVCTAAVLATALNLAALGLTAGHLMGMLSESLGVGFSGLPVLALVSVAPLALLFAFFVSAVLTGIASLAGSFKEGQAMLGPVQLLFIVPAMAGAIPGVELSMGLACVPVVNVVLAFRALLQGKMLFAEYAVVALSLCVYALVAVRLAVRLLSREGAPLASATVPLWRVLAQLRSPAGSR